jgi:cell division septum initiation protein DivIVA
MDLASRLQKLEDMIREAKSMPLSSSALLNRDEVLELVQEMRETLPEEIKQARWVVRDREELLAKARSEAERLVEEAREEQLQMARREEVVARAIQEAEAIAARADEEAQKIRDEAEDYVDAKLAQFETVLQRIEEEAQSAIKAVSRTVEQVESGRMRLRATGTVADQELSPPAEESPE